MERTFEKIIGYEKEKLELLKIIDQLKNEEKYAALGIDKPKGLLIHGYPGTGKTTMAREFIRLTGRKSYICRKKKTDGSFVDEITKIFEDAKENAPSVILLDDLDKFTDKVGHKINASEFVTVQACIDEIGDKDVFVIATTNKYTILPDSLCRADRLEKYIHIMPPSGKDAEDITRYYLSQKKYIGDVDAKELSKIMVDKSCADLKYMINEAGVLAGYRGKDKIDMYDLVTTCLQEMYGINVECNSEDEKNMKLYAYHEAGHIVASEILYSGSICVAAIDSEYDKNHDDKGIVVTKLDKDNHSKAYMNSVIVALAGKAAVELEFDEFDVGANDDMHKATKLLSGAIDDLCINGFDTWVFDEKSQDSGNRRDYTMAKELERLYRKTLIILGKNKKFLDKVASELVEKRVLLSKDIARIKEESIER